jgi:hypothetical protein
MPVYNDAAFARARAAENASASSGQGKLALSLNAFLLYLGRQFPDIWRNAKLHLVYPGAAPGFNVIYFAALPCIARITMYDPGFKHMSHSDFMPIPDWMEIEYKSKIVVKASMFTEDDAKELGASKDYDYVVMFNDVRLNEPTDIGVLRDQSQAVMWARHFDASALKYRPIGSDTAMTWWPRGTVWHQPLRRGTSAECRVFLLKEDARHPKGPVSNNSVYSEARFFNERVTQKMLRSAIGLILVPFAFNWLALCEIADAGWRKRMEERGIKL